MSQKFPLDEFDSVASHGGRHRVRRTPKIRALEFLRIVVVALLVAVVGYFGLKFVDSANLFSTSEPVPTISVTDIAKGLEITVLDATTTTGTADRVAATLVDGGFNVVSAGLLGGDVAGVAAAIDWGAAALGAVPAFQPKYIAKPANHRMARYFTRRNQSRQLPFHYVISHAPS